MVSCRFLGSSVCRNAKHYDCIISGGGMVGSALACAMGVNPLLKNLKILLIEAGPKGNWELKPKFSNRVSAINDATKELFESLGVWESIKTKRCHQVEDLKVWGYCSSNNIHFSDSNKKNVAHIVENDIIVNSIHEKLQSASHVDVLYDTKVMEVKVPNRENIGSSTEIQLNNSDILTCQLLVGADGAKSKVREAINPLYLSWSYHQSAVVATLKVIADDQNTIAWQRFLPDGPIALLPLGKGTSSLVWSTSTEKAKDLQMLSGEDFVDALNTALITPHMQNDFITMTGSALTTVLNTLGFVPSRDEPLPPFVKSVEEGSRASFPLEFGHSTKYVAPGVALIGDAAHKVHPLAGQGVNLGFSDIRYITKSLSNGIMEGRQFGEMADLVKYEQESQLYNIPMMASIDMLHRLYVTDIGMLQVVGDACIQIAGSVGPIQNAMKKFASGLR